MRDELEDLSGKVVHEVGIVESLAVSAAEVADDDDPETCRRLRDLVVQIGIVAEEAFASARELNAKIKGEAEPHPEDRGADGEKARGLRPR